ncbi:MAG TPA: c-type cytochrome domain-containing protein [Candidatus Acidoferrales bacterium]|nr:c-type cytochrome domain-containing protein [Candidatus Acidoferrales bacterium]
MRELKKHQMVAPPPGAFRASRFPLPASLSIFTFCFSLSAAETNSVILPPPADVQIVFDRDIQPLLETSCLRCHGGEKPRSHFRLDERDAALAGGDENTNDLVPGDSTNSWLIRYVARQVKDMEMPPMGKGSPLTPEQVGLLRAWIDQGANWNTTNQTTQLGYVLAPAVGGIGVQGDKAKFRELQGVNDGFSGGVDEFSFIQQTSPTEKFSLTGHAIVPDQDFKLNLAIDEADQGFLHAGFDEWRKYYDDSGGYDTAVVPPQLSLDRDLYVDNGRFWIDLGLTLPRWPQMVLGYEYDFKRGNKSMLDWGNVGGVNGVNIAPSTKAVDEQTQIIKFDLTHDIDDWHLEDNARVEFYSENNRSYETNVFQQFGGPTGGTTYTADDYYHVQGMNTLMVEKQLLDWWFLSGGYYYSNLEGNDFFNQTNSPNFTGTDPASWSSGEITLRRDSQIFSVSSLFLPLDYLSFSVGSQNEWTHQEGFGDSVPNFETGAYNAALADYDEFKASQDADLRFTRIPFTVLFAGARFDEGSIGEFQQESGGNLTNQTDATDFRYNLSAGFNTSPWRWVSWEAEYKRQYSDWNYNHPTDVFYDPFYGDPTFVAPENGYPAFILSRQIQSDGVDTRLTLHPLNWLRTTLSYQLTTAEYSSKTDPVYFGISPGGPLADGRSRAQIYGLSATLTPFRRFYFSGAFTYSHSFTDTATDGNLSVVPYQGDIYTLVATAAYALNPKTGLQVSYSFSDANYGQSVAQGVPLGIDFTRNALFVGLTRRLTQNLSGALRYEFAHYSEPSSGNLNDFNAQGVFATLIYKWP